MESCESKNTGTQIKERKILFDGSRSKQAMSSNPHDLCYPSTLINGRFSI
jgi:hypothetical protein